MTSFKKKKKSWSENKNLETGNWEGPFLLMTWGKGYACVSTGALNK
ncbi:hypothetical protein [Klebsiella pneumoniae]|nr:hypothetical protein [Klebsiella pneumoniae]